MIKSYPIGEACLCWAFANEIDETIVRKTLHIYKTLKHDPLMQTLGIHDLVPSYKSLAFHYDPLKSDYKVIRETLDTKIHDEWKALEGMIPELKGKDVILPVSYGGEDLSRVAAHCNMTEDEVIKIHTEGRYIVAMLGFKPHFPYLLGLDPRLETPRLETPRTRIPAGAVAIGGAQTGVYPEESPGGWNLIGQTDPDLLKNVEPGDCIIMKKVEK